MFYSHEVLTNRKYGVATVWLVATLGSKSSLKRITRKQMLDVDVTKACKTIVDPAAPMALRLQGNLLYVSSIYRVWTILMLVQCGYVLADAQSAHNTMMLMLRSVKNHALDPDAGKARPEQLVLQDDPSFLPEFALPPPELFAEIDLDFNLDISRSSESHSLTPFGSQQSPQSSYVGGYGLVLPSSSPDRLAGVGLEGDNVEQGNNDMLDIDNLLNLEELDFVFGEDGDIIEFTPGQRAPETPAVAAATGGVQMLSDAGASVRVRQEHEEGQQAGAQVSHVLKALIGDHMDIDLPVYGDDLPEAEATSSAVEKQPSGHSEQVIESASSVVAPIRQKKKKIAKVLPRDRKLELSNTEIVAWRDNYLENMKEAAHERKKKYVQQQAKNNAEYYVWGAGIGGLGRDYFAAKGPLAGFIGNNLFELFTGTSRNPKVIPKRDRDSGIDEATQEEARRKRQKTVEPEEEVARGRDDEGMFMPDGDEEIELPREAVSALDDQQIFSAMPWNISASKRGSSAIPLSGRVTMMSEQGRHGSRAGSRMVSASPLLRRSTGQFEALQSLDSDALGSDDFAFAAPSSDPAEPEEGATQASLRVREALSAEGENFFAFVAEAITNKVDAAIADPLEMPAEDQYGAIEVEQVTFEELLPPFKTNKMVACQGFLMLLSLGTKGMLAVEQPTAFEDITLKLTERTKAMQIVEVDDGSGVEPRGDKDMEKFGAEEDAAEEESESATEADDEEVLEPDDSHFQEQMAAGQAAVGGHDDHDSLYDSH
ncbi:R8 protein [Didymella sp. IMI 355093]|nr:R8 protein [Didymella sp. IMI 355093]